MTRENSVYTEREREREREREKERERNIFFYLFIKFNVQTLARFPRDVMVKAMDCGIVVSEYGLPLRYYVRFRTNALENGMESFYPQSYGLISVPTLLLEGWLWH